MEAQSGQPFPLNQLPLDILIVVLQQLPAKDLCLAGAVCAAWHKLQALPSTWAYIYERDFLVDLYQGSNDPATWKQLYISDAKSIAKFKGEILNDVPTTAESLLKLSKEHSKLKHFAKSVSDLTRALALGSDSNTILATLHIERAFSYRRLMRYPEMFADMEKSMTLSPQSIDVVCACGIVASNEGFYEKAEDFFDRGIAKAPTHMLLHYQKAEMLFERKCYDRALLSYNKAIELDPKRSSIRTARARTHMELGDLETAVAEIDEAIRLDPTNATLVYWRGRFKNDMGRYDEAYTDFSIAIDLNPSALYFNWRGMLQLHINHLEGALADTKKASSLDPKSPQDLGIVYYVLGRFDLALQCFTTAVNNFPKNSNNYIWRSTVYIKERDWPNAMRDLDMAVQCQADDMSYFWHGLGNLDMGNLIGGWNDLEKAYRFRHPASARVCFWLGIAYTLRGKDEDAKAKWLEANKAAESEKGLVLATGKLTEPARVNYFLTKTTTFAKEQYERVFAGVFGGDTLMTEEYYLTLLVKLFPDDEQLAPLQHWYQAKRKAFLYFEGDVQ